MALRPVSAEVVAWRAAPRVIPPPEAELFIDGERAVSEPIVLRGGERVSLRFGSFTLHAELVPGGDEWSAPPPGAPELGTFGGLALSALAHVLWLTVLAITMPRSSPAMDAEITNEQIAVMQTLLDDARATLVAAPPSAAAVPSRAGADAPAREPMRKPASPLQGPMVRAAPASAVPLAVGSEPVATPAEVRSFGMIALVPALKNDPGEPRPFQEVLAALGAHEAQTKSMFADPTIDKMGPAGLLSGVGSGGGGNMGSDPDAAIDRGNIGGLGTALDRELAWMATCKGDECPGHLSSPRDSPHPVRWHGDIAVAGALDEGAIKRVIHASAGRVEACYGAGLRTDPALAGSIVVSFSIGERGDVQVAEDVGGTLSDPSVRACIVKTFFVLKFPPHRGEPVRVKYPVVLKPSG